MSDNIFLVPKLLQACHQARQITELQPPLPQGITPRHIHIIHIIQQLHAKQANVRVSQISEALQVTRPSITRMLNELEQLQVIRKYADTQDKRVTNLELTALGKEYYAYYVKAYHQWVSTLLAEMNPEDIQTTIATISRFAAIMQDNYKKFPAPADTKR